MTEASGIKLKEERIDTDVLVVGAGVGGMMAAISAADLGARVIICEKGNAKRSGGITGGNDHFLCYIPKIHGPALKEKFIREIMNMGILDEDTAHRYIDLSSIALQKWESWGATMKTNGHYEFVGHGWPGSSGKTGEPGKTDRQWLHFSDEKLCGKLEKQVRDRNIAIMNRVMVTEILKDSSGRATGAIGISTREPKLYIFQTKGIVINKGGVDASRLYPSPHIIGYSMAEPGTGDGIMMAYRAGAEVQNAELTRRQVSMRFGPFAGKGTWIGVTRDAEGKTIAPPHLTKPSPETGDMSIENADAIDHAWAMGKGPVWMDPRGISEEDERYMRWGFESEAMHPFLRWLDREKIDISKTRFEFVTMQPQTNIQVRIDADCRTNIEGLFVISPGLLSWSAVFGMVAGEAAANGVQDMKPSDLAKNDKVAQTKQQYEEFLSRNGTQYASWREAQWVVWQTMYCYAMPSRRTENTLMAGHNQLLRVREKAKQLLRAGNQHDLYHCLEVLNMLDIAELVLLAVNERRESRGQARRLDYPFVDPMLGNKHLVIAQKDGRPAFRWEESRRIS